MPKKLGPREKVINDFCLGLNILFDTLFWDIRIHYATEDEGDALATISMLPYYRSAVITIHPQFFEKKPLMQAQCLIHEMCHTLVEKYDLAARDLLKGNLVTDKMLDDLNEEVTEHICQIICKLTTTYGTALKRDIGKYIKRMNAANSLLAKQARKK